MNRLQYDMSVPFFKSGTSLVLNGGAVFVLNGGAVFVLNGRAVSLDSQGCKPLVGIPTMIRESRSDAIDSSGASRDTVSHPANITNHTDNATAPPFPILRGGAVSLVLNGRAVSLDSQGCKPLVGIPTMIRESRSDAIDSYGASRDTVSHPANTTNHTDNATAPSFPILRGTMSRGLHPWLSNTIAPRFRTNTTHDPYRIAPRVKIKSFETKINI